MQEGPSATPPAQRSTSTVLWRVASLGVVLAAVTSFAWFMAEQIEESPLIAVGARSDQTPSVSIRVAGFGDPEGLTVFALRGSSTTTEIVDRFALAHGVEVPADRPYLLGVTEPDGGLIGLALVTETHDAAIDDAAIDDASITVSPLTTAQALVALAPAILHADASITEARMATIDDSIEFEQLVAVLGSRQNLHAGNPDIETALSAVLDRVPGQEDAPARACGGPAAAGLCFATGRNGAVDISNVETRWAALFAEGSIQPCALVPPKANLVAVTIGNSELGSGCPPVLDVAAPGTQPDGRTDAAITQRRIAAGLTAFTEYAAPFIELAFANSSMTEDDITSAITASPTTTGALIDETLASAEASDRAIVTLSDPVAPSQDRALAMLTLSRLLIADPDVAVALLRPPGSEADEIGFAPNPTGAALLTLYDRVHLLRSGGAGPTAWATPGWAQLDLTELLDIE